MDVGYTTDSGYSRTEGRISFLYAFGYTCVKV